MPKITKDEQQLLEFAKLIADELKDILDLIKVKQLANIYNTLEQHQGSSKSMGENLDLVDEAINKILSKFIDEI